VTAVVNARFCAPEATAFAVAKTISSTGRDFTVTDAAGAAVMQVEAEVFAFLKKSLLLDATRRPVLAMQDSPVLGGARWEVFRGRQHQPEEPALHRGEAVVVPDQDQDLHLPGRQRQRGGA
jgi:hypothetical protein